ncbi:MAG: TetR/AcrR family transcriptional regulator [Sphingomonas fennica]
MVFKVMDDPLSVREARRRARRGAILAVARAAFLEQGYAGTSMSTVAQALGGSKGTLWAYFASKEELFAAVLDQLVEEYGPPPVLDPAAAVDRTLEGYAVGLLTTTLSPPILALNRLVIAESARFPDLGRLFYARAPERKLAVLAEWLVAQMARGALRPADPMRAAMHFHQLTLGRQTRTLWGVEPLPADTETIAADARAATAVFLGGYAT